MKEDSLISVKWGFNDVRLFNYDASGNMVGYNVYDNKINIHRTNKIWMFIDRDYSINNPHSPYVAYSPGTYNSFGLPVQINYLPNFLGMTLYPGVEVKYQCDEVAPPSY